jgi:hypothetical protein
VSVLAGRYTSGKGVGVGEWGRLVSWGQRLDGPADASYLAFGLRRIGHWFRTHAHDFFPSPRPCTHHLFD